MNHLSIDVGTTCCKCQLFSEDGVILAYKSEEYALKKEGCETYVDIDEIWRKVKGLMSFAVAAGGFESICFSTFGESFVLLDAEDRVLFPPMLYTDPRGEQEAEWLLSHFGSEELFLHTGVLPQSMFSLAKLLWIKAASPQTFCKADKLMLICDWLGYKLTGERVIDWGLASRTGAFNIRQKAFDEKILRDCGIPLSLFSVPKPAGTVVGKVNTSLCKDLEFSGECSLVLGSHDQICAALGSGIIKTGEAVDGMGTVECITAVFEGTPSDTRMGHQGYPVVPYATGGLSCTYMFNYSSGSLVNWFKNNLLHGYKGSESDFFSYIEKTMPQNPTGVLTLPYFAGAATPYQNIRAKGAILNLTTGAMDAVVYKAILEGTAMEMRFNCEIASQYGIDVKSVVAAGGGTNSSKWLQIKADIQGIPIYTLRSTEGGLCGCAILQSIAMGLSKDAAEAAHLFVRKAGEYLPNQSRHAQYEEQYQKYKRLYELLKEFYL